MNGLQALQLADGMIRDTDVSNLPLLLEVHQSLPALFNFVVGFRPVHLVEIDAVHIEPPQTFFTLGNDAVSLQATSNLTVSLRNPSALRRDERSIGLRNGLHRLRNMLLAPAFSIDRCRVDPVDSQFHGSNDGLHGGRLVLITPPELPFPSANGPRPQSNHTELQAARAKSSKLHRVSPVRPNGTCH